MVINCTGIFTDGLRRMDDDSVGDVIEPSQGIHIVLDRDFLPGDAAIMIPKTDDGRVLFAIPWLGRVILGTTDTPGVPIELDPVPQQDEIDYLVEHAGRYLAKKPTHADIRATFAGIRPLVRPPKQSGATSEISRDHSLFVSDSGLVTLAGGKWTTCRKMAEDCIDQSIRLAGLPARACVTHERKLNESREADQFPTEYQVKLHESLPYTRADVIAAVRHEMAQTLDDVLSRRTRCPFSRPAGNRGSRTSGRRADGEGTRQRCLPLRRRGGRPSYGRLNQPSRSVSPVAYGVHGTGTV